MYSVTRILTFTQHFEMQQKSVHKNLNILSLSFLWRKWQSIQRVASSLTFIGHRKKFLLCFLKYNNNILAIKIKVFKHIWFTPHRKISKGIIKSQTGVFKFQFRACCYLNKKTSIVSDAWILGPQLMVLFRPLWKV